MLAPVESPEAQRWAVLDAQRVAAEARWTRAQQRLTSAQDVLGGISREAHAALASEAGTISPALQKRYTDATGAIAKLEAAVADAESAMLEARATAQTFAEWEQRSRALTLQLNGEYQGHGPQYEILIRRLVQAEMHARQLETVGKVGAPEHERATRTVLHLVQALQKYTEENASVRKAINDAVLQALGILEPEIRTVAPQAWTNGIKKLQARLLGQEAG